MRGLGADPAHLLHFVEGFAHANQAYAAARGIEDDVGELPSELLPELVTHRFLSFDAIRLLERGNVVPAFAIFVLGDVFAAIGDEAVQLDDLCAKCLALHNVGRGRVHRHHDDRG
jgi:hypothetical protein